VKLREQMPELTGATNWLNGYRDKADLVGDKPTLIHFWSVSCHLCKETMPYMSHLRDIYSGKLNVIAVHMPRVKGDWDLTLIRQIAAMHDITQPVLIDNELALSDAFDVQYVPAYYIFDKDGELRHSQTGGHGMKMLAKRVKRVLDEV
jgi:thiol-disulfide isomerase/thioredoxin